MLRVYYIINQIVKSLEGVLYSYDKSANKRIDQQCVFLYFCICVSTLSPIVDDKLLGGHPHCPAAVCDRETAVVTIPSTSRINPGRGGEGVY